MYLVAEAERRIDRGRQIVARQRELVEKVGAAVPVAVELLKAYETTLALLENTLANYQRHEPAVCNAEVLSSPIADAADNAVRDDEEQVREVAYLMEILRAGGYHCEHPQDTLH